MTEVTAPAQVYGIAVYQLYRNYGGPEEGGWWYDSGQLERTTKRVFVDIDEASEVCHKMNHWLRFFQRRNKRPNRFSMAYSGGEYRYEVFENEPVHYWPENRPFYE